METGYKQLTADDRNMIQRGLSEGLSGRQIAQHLGRCPSTVTRELARNQATASDDAVSAGRGARGRRRCGRRQLVTGSPLLRVVITDLKADWSPEQIAGRLKHMHPDEPNLRVSHETIYGYIYAQPRGELRQTLIAALRQTHKTRLPRTRGQARRGRLRDMVSIHERPTEAGGRGALGGRPHQGRRQRQRGRNPGRTQESLCPAGQSGWRRCRSGARRFHPPYAHLAARRAQDPDL